jgi:CRISPR-associated endonuclease/helicase Cas3
MSLDTDKIASMGNIRSDQGAGQRYYRYWGKARPSISSAAAYHLLPYHCLDVAAVGRVFLQRSPGLRHWLGAVMGASDEELLGWISFWLTLHDLGKFSEAFQGQCPDAVTALRGASQTSPRPYSVRHDTLGMVFWSQSLFDRAVDEEWFGPRTDDYQDGLHAWMRAVTGHHGQPPLGDAGIAWTHHFEKTFDAPAIQQFCQAARELFLSPSVAQLPTTMTPPQFERNSKALSWWVAGLAVLADWVGSNTDFFGYRADADDPTPLREYWNEALAKAEVALSQAGVLPIGTREAITFAALFPSIETPSPLQHWAASVTLSEEPQIHLLEDVTGSGKTEAAVMLAHRLIASGHVDGFYIALPTMATANAMYGRIAKVYAMLFEGDPSLVLAHGQRNLVEAFAASVLVPGAAEHDARQEDETATARCTAWLADHQKRALLCPAGVGTIDQALAAVLHSKHQSLRLLGLARKVLIVDEVHACDAYMQALLERLLEFHAVAGGSAILLSATLPQRMKESLVAAYARGRGEELAGTPDESAFPLVTSWRSNLPRLLEQQAIDTRDAVRRTVATHYCHDESEVVAAIERSLARGECACWMRNTVADALAAQQLLSGKVAPEKLILFHARFALCDRLDIERGVLEHFGPDSTPEQRAGWLVIATQVAEQSLDADWDFLVSDLAPIDRVVQRAGRLRRHPRDAFGARLNDPAATDQRGPACLWVLAPTWADAPSAGWFKAAFPKAAFVYPDHAQLWRTAKLLGEGRFTMPDDARRLIETVFAQDAETPEGLQANANAAEGRGYGDSSLAQQHTLKLLDGYVRGGIDWWSEAKTTTRLGEESTTVLLARWEGDRLRPWSEHANPRHAWAYSTVRVAARSIAKSIDPASAARKAELERVAQTLPDQGKWSVVLPLEQSDHSFVGAAWTAPRERQEPRRQAWAYDERAGLRVLLEQDPTTGEDA